MLAGQKRVLKIFHKGQPKLSLATPRAVATVDLQPLLKWAGGKRRLLEQYSPFLPERFDAYFEPFVGGAAVFLELTRRGLAPSRQRVRLSDINQELINLYAVVQRRPQDLLEVLRQLAAGHSQEHFYAVRAWDLTGLDEVQRAARLVYLNRTCYNGLYRVNSQGQFNVPCGRYRNPSIVNEPRLLAMNAALQGVEIEVAPYSSVSGLARAGDLVYFDPPYHPLSSTANFTSYASSTFGEQQQRELAQLFRELDERGVRVLLSNSDSPLIRELYRDFAIQTVSAARFINSDPSKRSPINELLVLGHTLAG